MSARRHDAASAATTCIDECSSLSDCLRFYEQRKYEMAKEFLAFLKNYGVIGLAIAVIIGGKANAMVDAVVKELLMPLVGLLLPSGDWRNLAITVGETKFGIGPVLAALIDFLIVALIVFLVAKKVLKEEVVTKK